MKPQEAYDEGVRRGWFDALGDAGKCAAYNFSDPPPSFALCVREDGHSGRHDDMWRQWGDSGATKEQNRIDAVRAFKEFQTFRPDARRSA